jgi:hypothetical protein
VNSVIGCYSDFDRSIHDEEDSESSNNNVILETLNNIAIYSGVSLGNDEIIRKFGRHFLRYIQQPIDAQIIRFKLEIVKKFLSLQKPTGWIIQMYRELQEAVQGTDLLHFKDLFKDF